MPGRYPRPVDVLHGYTVLRGLRSYYRRTVPMHAQTHASQQEAARIEIHLDGTVAACVTRGGTDYSDYGSPSTPGAIAVSDIENTAADLFTLAVCAQTALGVRGDFAARIGITPPTQLFRHPDRSNPAAFRPYQEIDRVATPQPVDGPLLTSMGAA